ncbi:MAG: methyltransferase domain-containing protein [Wenzhouxiangellaceae bacterium]|nr:methyltransferase domain-containing protein [Wenzhouxiangellaceae bacterium]MBS3746880.1 methyltransferase domain-containing protein [Wenzhouxiangellaceae bacterium]MBS3824703.1 methyltransferase domain-containing protein [Wenzhouxiangellaceae bacterium]
MNDRSDSNATQIARDYYNSKDADLFYREVWGGQDIHVGLYDSEDEPIAPASRRTAERMVDLSGPWTPETRVIDLGAGYGGSMRYLAERFGCHCVALNLSDVENDRNRRMNREAGLDERIDVVEGDFASLDFADASFDRAWSQEAFLHSGQREKVLAETARVLKPGGRLVFTDPMQADDAPADSLQDIYDRLHLDSLASPSFYRNTLDALGLEQIAFEESPEQLARHYARVREVLIEKSGKLREKGVDGDYIERMKAGLNHWVEGGRNGVLTWGILVFEKRRPG